MGSHAFMLDPEERWKVIHFVKSLAYGDDFEYSAVAGSSSADSLTMLADASIEGDVPSSDDENASGQVEIEIHK